MSDFRSARPRLQFWTCLLVFGAAGLLLRFGLAQMWPTLHRPDETFQNLEPAYRLWTGWGVIPWEWRDGIRSWLFPGFLYGIMQATSLLHLTREAALSAITAVLSLIASGVVVMGVVLGWRRSGVAGAVLCGLLCACWPDLVYFGPKALLEVQAGNLLVIAAVLASLDPFAAGRRRGRLGAIGLLLGLAFALRFQLALPLALVACWAGRLDARRWAPLLLGAAVPVILLGAVDWATWGSPFQSIWKNILVNFGQGKANEYGVEPAGWYIAVFLSRYGAAILPLGVCFWLGMRHAPLLASTAALVLLFHSAIPHKEISFVYAAIPPAMIVVGLGAAAIVTRIPLLVREPPRPTGVLVSASLVTIAFVMLTGIAAAPFRPEPEFEGLRSAWTTLRGKSDLCGVGLFRVSNKPWWSRTAGYVGLRRDVPMYPVVGVEDLERARPGFNYLVTRRDEVRDVSGFDLLDCSQGVCVMHRGQPCTLVPDMTINAFLAREQM